jgi:flagellar basal-body rod protein FlgB
MSDKLFSSNTVDLLKRSLDAYSLRQRVIAENIANAETPGFKARQVEFETLLREAGEVSMRMRNSGPAHQSKSEAQSVQALVHDKSDRAMDNGINNVSIDMEMAALAETNLNHKLSTRALTLRYQLLRNSVRGRS